MEFLAVALPATDRRPADPRSIPGRIKGVRYNYLPHADPWGRSSPAGDALSAPSGLSRKHGIAPRCRTSQFPAVGPMPAAPSRCDLHSTVKMRGLQRTISLFVARDSWHALDSHPRSGRGQALRGNDSVKSVCIPCTSASKRTVISLHRRLSAVPTSASAGVLGDWASVALEIAALRSQ